MELALYLLISAQDNTYLGYRGYNKNTLVTILQESVKKAGQFREG